MKKAHTNTLLALSVSLTHFNGSSHTPPPPVKTLENLRFSDVFSGYGSEHWLEMDYRLYTNDKVLNGSYIATHQSTTVHL